MKLNPILAFLLLAFLLTATISCGVKSKSEDLVDIVDPFIGANFFGHTFPGASVPFAMVHLSPDIHTEGWTYCSGYNYTDNSIIGFSHTHWSGVGMVNGGEILLMPTVGDDIQIFPGSKENPDKG